MKKIWEVIVGVNFRKLLVGKYEYKPELSICVFKDQAKFNALPLFTTFLSHFN